MSHTLTGERFKVIARSGLRLREGPGTEFDIIGGLLSGQIVFVASITDGWARVDVEGDGHIDGFASAGVFWNGSERIYGNQNLQVMLGSGVAPLSMSNRTAQFPALMPLSCWNRSLGPQRSIARGPFSGEVQRGNRSSHPQR